MIGRKKHAVVTKPKAETTTHDMGVGDYAVILDQGPYIGMTIARIYSLTGNPMYVSIDNPELVWDGVPNFKVRILEKFEKFTVTIGDVQ